jgi:hypothetical protein
MLLQNKSDNRTVHHALQSCQIRMVLQNKLDNSNGHALKWSNFHLNLSFEDAYRRNEPIFAKTYWETKIFAQTKIFAKRNFAKMETTVFVSTLLPTHEGSEMVNPKSFILLGQETSVVQIVH